MMLKNIAPMGWLMLAASCGTAASLPPGVEVAGSSTAGVEQDGRTVTYELRELRLTGSEVFVVYEPETRLAWWVSHPPGFPIHLPDRLNTTSTGIGVSTQRLVVFSVGGPTRLFADQSTARFSSAEEAQNEIARSILRSGQTHPARAVAEIELREKLDSSFSYASDGSQRLMTIAAVGRHDGHWLVTLRGPNGDRADVTLTDDYKLIDLRRSR